MLCARLPNELLVKIFRAFIRRHSLDSLTLCHVCRRWRDLALVRAEFWSSIGIHAHESPDTAGVERLTKLYLARSGSCPLDFLLAVPSLKFFQLFTEHSSRWISLHLCTSEAFIVEALNSEVASSIRGRLPLLEELVINCTGTTSRPNGEEDVDYVDPDEWFYTFDALEIAPKLRIVKLDIPDIDLSKKPFPRCGIEHIFLRGRMTFRDVSEVLRSCSRLQSARFVGVPSNNCPIPPPIRSSLSSLTSLSITTQHFQVADAEDLLDGFTFPSLTTLEFRSERIFKHSGTTRLPKAFLHGACINLRTLKLSWLPNILEGQLLDLFRCTPLLETLDLRDDEDPLAPIQPVMLYSLSIALLRQLTFHETLNSTEQSLLPYLRCLRVHVPVRLHWFRSEPSGWFEAFFCMIASRRRPRMPEGVTQLEIVGLGPRWSAKSARVPKAAAQLEKELRAEGLAIE